MRKNIVRAVAVLGILSVIGGLFCGCGAKAPKENENTFSKADYLSDTDFLGIYYHHDSMEREPYYVIGRVGESYYFKTTRDDPMYDEKGELISECFSSADHISDVEADMSCKLSEDSVTKLRETIAMYPVLSWDGFDEAKKGKAAVCDGDDGFAFNMQLSDKTLIKASGVGAYPKLFCEFIGKIIEICMNNRPEENAAADCGFTGLFYHHEGTMREPYYVIVRTDSGYCLKVCYEDPHYDEDYNEVENIYEVPSQLPEDSFDEYYYLTEEEAARIEKAVSEYPVRSWDGFRESRSADPDMLDGGDSFQFELVLDDGEVINVEGSYAHPEKFDEFILIILDICMSRE